MTANTCQTCPNWTEGTCRAYPPADAEQSLPWPRCDAEHWCGLHPARYAAWELAVKDAKRALRKERLDKAVDALPKVWPSKDVVIPCRVDRVAGITSAVPPTPQPERRSFGHANGVFFATGDLVWHKDWDKDTGAVRLESIVGSSGRIATDPPEVHELRDLKLARRGDLNRDLA